jgi:hypothetical protein
MKIRPADPKYLERAMQLSKEEAERLFLMVRGELTRRVEDHSTTPLEAIASQLELEDEALAEWRIQFSKIRAAH